MPGSSIGRRLVLTSVGESHGKMVGAVLDGCPAGLPLAERDIQGMLDQRRPGQSIISTQRKEKDAVEIVSGVFEGRTTGAPITMLVWNRDQHSHDYDGLRTRLRPGHSDYPAMVKYGRHNDHRGGGRFSGRLTATHVMGGAIARKLLRATLGVRTVSYTSQIGRVSMRGAAAAGAAGASAGAAQSPPPPPPSPSSVYKNDIRCPDPAAADRMRAAILDARRRGDSLGGIVESVTTNVPVGLGEPVFGSLESDLSRALFSIPSVKGVEFGSGFEGARLYGSQNNDLYTVRNGRIVTRTNNSGGILGGISNGMPITIRIAFKPASSIAQKQRTVDISTMKRTTLQVTGRHDPCVVPRAPPVVDALVALTIADHALLAGAIPAVLQ